MTKIMTGFWFLMTVLIGVGTYWVSHEVERLERRYSAIQSDILDEQESIHVFQAEWSYLNAPGRIEKLAKEYLKLDQIQPLQMASIDTIPTDTDARRYRLDKFGEAVAYMPAPRDRPGEGAYDEASENMIIDAPSVGFAAAPKTGDQQ